MKDYNTTYTAEKESYGGKRMLIYDPDNNRTGSHKGTRSKPAYGDSYAYITTTSFMMEPMDYTNSTYSSEYKNSSTAWEKQYDGYGKTWDKEEEPSDGKREWDGDSEYDEEAPVCSAFDREFGGFWCDKATEAACEYWPDLEQYLCQNMGFDYDQYWNQFEDYYGQAEQFVEDYFPRSGGSWDYDDDYSRRGGIGEVSYYTWCGDSLDYSSVCDGAWMLDERRSRAAAYDYSVRVVLKRRFQSEYGNELVVGDMLWFHQGFSVNSPGTDLVKATGLSDELGFVLTDTATSLAVGLSASALAVATLF